MWKVSRFVLCFGSESSSQARQLCQESPHSPGAQKGSEPPVLTSLQQAPPGVGGAGVSDTSTRHETSHVRSPAAGQGSVAELCRASVSLSAKWGHDSNRRGSQEKQMTSWRWHAVWWSSPQCDPG